MTQPFDAGATIYEVQRHIFFDSDPVYLLETNEQLDYFEDRWDNTLRVIVDRDVPNYVKLAEMLAYNKEWLLSNNHPEHKAEIEPFFQEADAFLQQYGQ